MSLSLCKTQNLLVLLCVFLFYPQPMEDKKDPLGIGWPTDIPAQRGGLKKKALGKKKTKSGGVKKTKKGQKKVEVDDKKNEVDDKTFEVDDKKVEVDDTNVEDNNMVEPANKTPPVQKPLFVKKDGKRDYTPKRLQGHAELGILKLTLGRVKSYITCTLQRPQLITELTESQVGSLHQTLMTKIWLAASEKKLCKEEIKHLKELLKNNYQKKDWGGNCILPEKNMHPNPTRRKGPSHEHGTRHVKSNSLSRPGHTLRFSHQLLKNWRRHTSSRDPKDLNLNMSHMVLHKVCECWTILLREGDLQCWHKHILEA